MRLPSYAMAVTAVAALALALSPKVHAASLAGEGHCQLVAPSIRGCVSQRGVGSYLLIEHHLDKDHDREPYDRQVGLFIVDGKVAVPVDPADRVTLHIVSFPTAAQMAGNIVPVYKEGDTMEIDSLWDPQQQRLSWIVRTGLKTHRLSLMCTGSGCSGSSILLSIE